MKKKVSVIIPTFNEEEFIISTLRSLLKTQYPTNLLEFIIVDGNSSDQTIYKLKQFISKKNIKIKILNNPQRITPISLNIGIKASQGDIIIRADAHTIYPPNYIDQLIKWKEKLGADNVGGVFVHTPKEHTKINHAIVSCLESKFGVGNSLYRILRTGEPMEVDTVPFGIFDRNLFDRIGYFNERLARNQDIEFNKRITTNGGKIFLIPSLHLKYFPRSNLKQFAKYNFVNGLWNIRTIIITNSFKSLSIRHFIPLFFVLALLGNLLLSFYNPIFRILLFLILISYFSLALITAVKNKKKNTTTIHILLVCFVLHFFYGLGEIWALLTAPFIKNKYQ